MKCAVSLFLSIFISFHMFAQSEYEKKIFITKEGKELPYRILYPENYNSKIKYPLLLFLHGAGERGNDNEKQLIHGSGLFTNPNNRAQFPAIVIFPQCPQESYWSSVKIDTPKTSKSYRFIYSNEPKWPLQAAVDLVKEFIRDKKADEKRIYIMGLSMGGMGTFEAISRNPKLFAAAIPICGGGDTAMCKKYSKKVRLWIFHGSLDNVVSPVYSREMFEKLKSLKSEVKYIEYPDVGHSSWDNAFAEPELLKWIFEKRLKR
jgi:predicted peptidase